MFGQGFMQIQFNKKLLFKKEKKNLVWLVPPVTSSDADSTLIFFFLF